MKHSEEEWQLVEKRAAQLESFFAENDVPMNDRMAFAYYNLQAPLNSLPEWTLPYFDRGILPQGGYGDFDLDKVDLFGGLLVPNYAKRAEGLPPLLDAAKPLADTIIEGLKTGSFFVSSNHPTLPTPILLARPIIEAVKDEIPDIQKRIYITYGMLPVMFKFDFGYAELSPAAFAAGLGNVAVTAAVSDSNMQPHLQGWQSVYRNLYKANISSLLAEPGNIVIAALNGQRDVAFSKFNKKARIIHQPEGDVSGFVQPNAQFINCAEYDRLLDDPTDIGSLVQMYMNPRVEPITEEVLRSSNEWQAVMLRSTFDGASYYHEGVSEMARRLADRRKALESYMASKAGLATDRMRHRGN